MAISASDNIPAADLGLLEGSWILNYMPLIGNPHPSDPPRLGPDFFPGAAIGCLSIRGDGRYAGFLQFNLGGSSARREIEGTCTLAWDEGFAALCGEITVEGGGVVNTLFFVMRDSNHLEWMIVDTTAPSPDNDGGKYRFQLIGKMHRVQPHEDPALPAGSWITRFEARLRALQPGDPITLGSDFSPEAALLGLRFGADGKIIGSYRRNSSGRLPVAAPVPLSGQFEVQPNPTLGIHEGTMSLDWGGPSQAKESSDSLAFIVRNRNTIDWVVTTSTRPDFSATIACGTFKRLASIAPHSSF